MKHYLEAAKVLDWRDFKVETVHLAYLYLRIFLCVKMIFTNFLHFLCKFCIIIIIFFSLQLFQSLKKENWNNHSRNKRTTSTCTFKCTDQDHPVKPVCGSDGITYPNQCELQKVAKCSGKNVIFQQDGECSSGIYHDRNFEIFYNFVKLISRNF